MAGPVGHIFCALTIINSGALEVQDQQALMIGTNFPDIRYMGVIDREKTHVKNITWHDVINARSSFQAGMLLHSWLDRVREEYMIANDVYQYVPNIPFRSQCLKLFEDKLLNTKINSADRATIIRYFDAIHPEEKQFNISNHALREWHNFLQNYLKKITGTTTLQVPAMYFSDNTIIRAIKNKSVQLATTLINPLFKKVMSTLEQSEELKTEELKKLILNFYEHITDFIESKRIEIISPLPA